MTSAIAAASAIPRTTTLPLAAAPTPGANAGSVAALGGGINRTWLLVGAGAVLGCIVPIPGGPLGGAIVGYLVARFM